MSKDRRKRITPWLVIDETGSEDNYESPQEIEDSDSVYEVRSQPSKVAAKDKDNDEVVVVDIDKPNRKASDKDKDEPKNNRTAVRSKRETRNRNNTDLREEGKSPGTDKTLFATNAIIIDDDDDDADDEDVKLEKSVPAKNRKRKVSVDTVATKKVKTTRASQNKLTIDKFSDDEEEDSDSVIEYPPIKKTARKDKDVINRRGNVRDKDLEANTSAVATDVRKKRSSREADVREEKKSSDTNEIQIIIDDGDDAEVIKVETDVRIENTKRKGSSRVTTTEKTKIVRATSSKKKVKIDEIGESLSAVDSAEKMKKNNNGDSDDVVEYQSQKKSEIKVNNKRSAIDRPKRKASAKKSLSGVTASRNIAVVEVKRNEEGSSYTEEEFLSSNEITIDDEEGEDITLDTKALAKNNKRKRLLATPAAKKAKTDKAPRKKLKIEEGNKKDNSSANVAVEWSESDCLSEFTQIEPQIAANLISLFKDDNTIPFIARYRKEVTGGMEPEQLRNIKNTYHNLKLVKQRALVILKTIDKSGKWSPEIHSAITGAKTMTELELIYAPFKPGAKRSFAERAKELGLASIGKRILQGQAIPGLFGLVDKTREGLRTENDVRQGIMHIIADVISKDKTTFEGIRKLRKIAVIRLESTKSKVANSSKTINNEKYENDLKKYENYLNFSAPEKAIKDYQILAINRGESQKILTVKVVPPDWFQTDLMKHCLAKYNFVRKVSSFHYTIIEDSFKDSYTRLIKPLITRQVRHDLNERAESASIEVFARNLKKLLLSPPLRGETVLGIDPGFNHGCKLAVISQWGNVLDTTTIYPHTKSRTNSGQHVQILASLIKKHNCRIVALGNGTACRETERFLTDLIQAHVFAPLDVSYTIVNEAGASIYSCSSEAKSEFPNLDPNVVSAVSIARRLQDPLAELIKIEPQHLGIGMYQLDLPKKQLQLTLNEVISEAVSFVGVDINTASHCLLTKVAGLSSARAQNIIKQRDELGSFSNRQDLLKVKGIGKKIFEQCAGFIRILPETALTRDESSSKQLDYLDQTWIHPESYDVARRFLEACKCDLSQLGMEKFIQKVLSYENGNRKILAEKFSTSEQSMDIILKGLTMKKGEDIRVKEDAPLFQRNLRCIDDLSVNTILTGSVRNVTNFGAFVDIGVGSNGLIPIGKMKGQTLSLGQKVEVIVLSTDKQRGRIALSL